MNKHRIGLVTLMAASFLQLSCGAQPPASVTLTEDEMVPNQPASPADSVVETVAQRQKATDSDWPQWRGHNRDGKSLDTGLLKKWPKAGPRKLWTFRDAGLGFSGPAVVGNRIYLLGTESTTAEIALAIDATNGKKIWATELDKVYLNGYGDGPRCTPTVDGSQVYVLTGSGTLACLDAQSGDKVWSKHLVRDFGGGQPGWGYCESPLVDGDKVLVTPGRKNCIVALDKSNGATIWQSSNLNDEAQYSSLIRHVVGAVPFYCTMTRRGLVGVSAESGRLLFRHEASANGTAVIPTPIPFRNFVFSTSGYGAGCGLIQLNVSGSTVESSEVYANKNMVNHHGGVILVNGNLYGYSDGKGWICQDYMTGKIVWAERKALPKGSIAFADGHLYCYSEQDGACVLIDAAPTGWKESGRIVIPEHTKLPRKSGHVWTHPVVAGGRLLLRDQDLLFAFDVKPGRGRSAAGKKAADSNEAIE